jgi:hypothetical protein
MKRAGMILMWKLKKQNLCILSDLAKTLSTRQVIPKNKEAAITLRLSILCIAEKTLAIRPKTFLERTSEMLIRTAE